MNPTDSNQASEAATEETPNTPLECAQIDDTSASDEAVERVGATWRERLVQVRELGKTQWNDALARARGVFAEGEAAEQGEPAEALSAELAQEAAEEMLEEPVEAAPSLRERAQALSASLFQGPAMRTAQDKGASLLLGTIRRVRATIESLEANLEAARPARGDEVAPA